MEQTPRYVFLKTIPAQNKDGTFVALIADAQILGEGGVRSMQLAFNAHAAPLSRKGLLPMTAEQLVQRLPELEEQGLDKSMAAFQRAIECVHKKNEKTPSPAAHTPVLQRSR